MANANSAKGNPASTRMSNPKYKAKRAANKIVNEQHENKARLFDSLNVPSNYNKVAGKMVKGGIVSRKGMANYMLNQDNQANAIHNANVLNEILGTNYSKIGLRRIRRILSGIDTASAQITEEQMKLISKSSLIGVDTFGYSVAYFARKSYDMESDPEGIDF